MKYLAYFFIGTLILEMVTSCSAPPISVQTEYITVDHLASTYVGTPDPRQVCPPAGQRLIIGYSLPKDYLRYSTLSLYIKLRYRNREEQELNIPIFKCRGNYIIDILNEQYCETGGILTYIIEVRGDDKVLNTWRHQLWVDLITLDVED